MFPMATRSSAWGQTFRSGALIRARTYSCAAIGVPRPPPRPAAPRCNCATHRFIPASVVRSKARIKDVANGFGGNGAEDRLNLLARRATGSRIHNQDAVIAGLDGNVAAGADDHPDVVANG